MSEVKPLSLSSAIRLGAMLKPQGFGNDAMSASAARSCALGAAGQAAGLNLQSSDYDTCYRFWSVLAVRVIDAPEGMGSTIRPCEVAEIVWRLNDECAWTREQIADWVESIEQQQEQQVSAEAVPVTVRP